LSSSTKWAASSCHGSLRASFTPCKVGGVGLNGAEFHPRSRVARELGESGGRCLRCARRASISGTAPPKISLYPCLFSGLTGLTVFEAAAAASTSPGVIAWAEVDAGGYGASVGACSDSGSDAASKARVSSELGPGAGVAPSAARPSGRASIRDVQGPRTFGFAYGSETKIEPKKQEGEDPKWVEIGSPTQRARALRVPDTRQNSLLLLDGRVIKFYRPKG
jgi:hypothetical protein